MSEMEAHKGTIRKIRSCTIEEMNEFIKNEYIVLDLEGSSDYLEWYNDNVYGKDRRHFFTDDSIYLIENQVLDIERDILEFEKVEDVIKYTVQFYNGCEDLASTIERIISQCEKDEKK